MMFWLEGIWYAKVTKGDIPEIIETYLRLEETDKKAEAAAIPAKG